MTDTFAALLTEQLSIDPGRPLVTFYDDETGERVELSVATYANWVAKTSSLFVEELDLERGGRLLVDLPTHWLTPVFLGAAWTVGLSVIGEAASDADGADAIVCGPDGLRQYADRAADLPVVACALRPLGVRFAEPLPGGVHDFGIEVWSQPDAFIPYDPPTGDDEAMTGVSQRGLLGRPAVHLEPGGRLLTNLSPLLDPATLVEALVSGGSTIWVRNADLESLQKKYDDERATARLVRLAG
jgi:uncharacterized protein (TIGR03089 family)